MRHFAEFVVISHLNMQKPKNILLIKRAQKHSPNSVDRDTAILLAVADCLTVKGHSVSIANEESLPVEHHADIILSMGRNHSTLQWLAQIEESGIPVLNSAKAMLGISRRKLLLTAQELGVGVPPFATFSGNNLSNCKSSNCKSVWAVQFHPEVFHSVQGSLLLKNFVVDICGSRQEWSAASFVDSTVAELKQQLGNDRVILGLSGGVDSSVAAVLLNKAIGNRLTCIFVDHGMLRKNEFQQVMQDYQGLGLNVIGVDASEQFFSDLAGISDPEQKRKIIGRDFVEVFNAEAKKIKDAKWLGQGTIYPDRIESLNITGKVIKSHHNVGGLPKEMNLQLCEPLKWLFKDEVRRVGRQLGMPEHLITRHPFPGPGLAVRILGDITREKVHILQEADDIYIRGLREYVDTDGETLYNKVWQAGAILLSTVRSVGVMGDERTYEHPVALRAVTSTDAMTADWAHLPYDFLAKVSNEIINKVRGVNRVCYDISSKPPATIEWE